MPSGLPVGIFKRW